MKTFVKYPGGKAKELSTIQDNMPLVVDRYFEPFVGGGSVFLGLEIKDSYINDISEDLIMLYNFIQHKDSTFMQNLYTLNEMWKALNEHNWEDTDFSLVFAEHKLMNVFKKYKAAEEKRKYIKIERQIKNGNTLYNTEIVPLAIVKAAFYYTVRYVYNAERNKETPNNITRTLAYYYLREFAYSSMFRFSSSGDFNVPYGGISYNNKSFDAKIDLIKSYNIDNAKIYNEDYNVFLKRFKFKNTDFVFVDPPYDSEFSDYNGNSFDKAAQVQLAEELSKLTAKVMVVIKHTDFIYNLYSEKGFNIKSFNKKYSVNIQNRNTRDVKHLLITNYRTEE